MTKRISLTTTDRNFLRVAIDERIGSLRNADCAANPYREDSRAVIKHYKTLKRKLR